MSSNEGPARGAAAHEILFFFLRLLGASIALYLLYYFVIGRPYVRFIALLSKPMLAIFGYEIVMTEVARITEDIALNPFVFLSLVVATSRVSWRSKLRGAGIGLVILAAANALTVTLVFVSNYRDSEAWWTGTELLNLTNNFFLPILLWLVLLPVRSAFSFLRDRNA